MTIVSIKAGSSEDVQKIEFSDGSFFSIKNCYLPYSPAIAEGYELTPDEESSFRFASACLRAEKAALQLIARAEQNTFNLSRKLEKRGHDSACIRAVIAQLCELGLLDDRRYARLWLESRIVRQASSPRRLLIALNARGIDRHDAAAALKETLDDEAERKLLERYAHKLTHKRRLNDDEWGQRSLRYSLKGEGFSSRAIESLFVD